MPREQFAGTVVPLYRGLSHIARDLLGAMAEHLDLPPEAFTDNIDPLDVEQLADGDLTASVLRICSYHLGATLDTKGGGSSMVGKVANEAGVLFDEHTDSSFITVALVSKIPGLQMRPDDQSWDTQDWVDIESLPGVNHYDIAVFVGDFCALFTKEYYKAARHRVVRPKEISDRISMPFLVRGRPEHRVDTTKYDPEGKNEHLVSMSGVSCRELRKLLDARGQRKLNEQRAWEEKEDTRRKKGAAARAAIKAEGRRRKRESLSDV